MSETEPDDLVLVLITYPEDATPGTEDFAERLVDRNLAACVNVISEVRSFFPWEGDLEEADEVLLVAKTSDRTYERLESFVESSHPYDEPEVIGLSLTHGSSSYLNWVQDCLT